MFLAVMEPNHVEPPASAIVQTGLRDRGGITRTKGGTTKAFTDFISGQTLTNGHDCLSAAYDLQDSSGDRTGHTVLDLDCVIYIYHLPRMQVIVHGSDILQCLCSIEYFSIAFFSEMYSERSNPQLIIKKSK